MPNDKIIPEQESFTLLFDDLTIADEGGDILTTESLATHES